MAVATKKDACGCKPMPEKHSILDFPYDYTEEQFAVISKGLLPKEMEDKWLMYMEDNILYMHRSWTGNCIYVMHFVKESDKYKVKKVVVNRDPDQYSALISTDDYEIENLRYMMDVFFTHEDIEMGHGAFAGKINS